MGTITKFKVEKHSYYREGFEKGLQQGIQLAIQQEKEKNNRDFIDILINRCSFSDKEAAKAIKVSIALIKQVRKDLESGIAFRRHSYNKKKQRA